MINKNELKKEKKWIFKDNFDLDSKLGAKKIAEELGLNHIIANLLYARGYKDTESAKKFIYMETEMLSNPFDMKDMELGISRIHKAIQNNEKITVYGDYDVDGVTAVCTLYLYLKSKGASIDYYIPNRTCEGYGVSTQAIDALSKGGTKLVVTVDTGITANYEVEYAKSLGIDFVITDHHECRSDLPEAVAVINPHRPDCPYPFKELAGVGVVFKFISAYEERYEGVSRALATRRIFESYADLVAIGTIADVMPIKSENRLIVSYGLKMLEETKRPGIAALIKASTMRAEAAKQDKKKRKTKVTSGFIGYTLAPRINAAGRIKSAEIAVELFLSDNIGHATEIAELLCAANKERQGEENNIMQDANKMIAGMDIAENPIIVLNADNWHHGVIGIVASRITEKFSRPSILISFKKNDMESEDEVDIGKGSGRSIKGLNLVDALCYCSEYLTKFGGHELAAGLSVSRENLESFKKKINEYAKSNLNEEDMIPTFEADMKIDFSDITLDFAEKLQLLEPYGVGNPVPTFVITGAVVNEITSVSDGKHTRFVFGDGNTTLSAMFFSNSPASLGINHGDTVDIMFTVDINEWMNRRSVQLIVKDIKHSHGHSSSIESQKNRYNQIHNGDKFGEEENILPSRDDFAVFYKFVSSSVRQGNSTFSISEILSSLSRQKELTSFNYIKIKIMIKVFTELNILGIEEIADDIYRFRIYYSGTKTDLEKSNILRKLRQQKIK